MGQMALLTVPAQGRNQFILVREAAEHQSLISPVPQSELGPALPHTSYISPGLLLFRAGTLV